MRYFLKSFVEFIVMRKNKSGSYFNFIEEDLTLEYKKKDIDESTY